MSTTLDIPSPFQPPAVIKPRDPKIAGRLALCCPGLGHLYTGGIRRGLLFLAGVDLSLALGALLLIAPWGGIRPAAALWIFSSVLFAWSVLDARKTLLATRTDYRLKDYNHWIAYLVIGFIPTTAVAVAIAVAIRTHLVQAIRVMSDLPGIGIARGDLFLDWKAAYQDRRPAIGDYIIYQGPLGSGKSFPARVAGLPGDSIPTPDGPLRIPQGSLGIQRSDGADGHFIISEMAVSGKLIHRFWPPGRFGSAGSLGQSDD